MSVPPLPAWLAEPDHPVRQWLWRFVVAVFVAGLLAFVVRGAALPDDPVLAPERVTTTTQPPPPTPAPPSTSLPRPPATPLRP